MEDKKEPEPQAQSAKPAEQAQPKPAEPAKPAKVAKAPSKEALARAEGKEDNTIYIGKKETMGYVLAVVTSFNRGAKEVVIKARGAAISRAVDVEETAKHRFITTLKVKEVKLSSEQLLGKSGHSSRVPEIEITVTKG